MVLFFNRFMLPDCITQTISLFIFRVLQQKYNQLEESMVEYKGRKDTDAQQVPLQEIAKFVQSKLCD